MVRKKWKLSFMSISIEFREFAVSIKKDDGGKWKKFKPLGATNWFKSIISSKTIKSRQTIVNTRFIFIRGGKPILKIIFFRSVVDKKRWKGSFSKKVIWWRKRRRIA